MIICSIDPGYVNLGIYVEEFDISNTNLLEGQNRYANKISIDRFSSGNISISVKICNTFKKIDKIMSLCDIFIIEAQMKTNPTMQMVSAVIQTYIYCTYGKESVIIDATSKSKKLGFYSDEKNDKKRKKERKLFNVDLAMEIVTLRKDIVLLSYINSLNKKDDICDAICQLITFRQMKYGHVFNNNILSYKNDIFTLRNLKQTDMALLPQLYIDAVAKQIKNPSDISEYIAHFKYRIENNPNSPKKDIQQEWKYIQNSNLYQRYLIMNSKVYIRQKIIYDQLHAESSKSTTIALDFKEISCAPESEIPKALDTGEDEIVLAIRKLKCIEFREISDPKKIRTLTRFSIFKSIKTEEHASLKEAYNFFQKSVLNEARLTIKTSVDTDDPIIICTDYIKYARLGVIFS